MVEGNVEDGRETGLARGWRGQLQRAHLGRSFLPSADRKKAPVPVPTWSLCAAYSHGQRPQHTPGRCVCLLLSPSLTLAPALLSFEPFLVPFLTTP